MEFSLTPRQQLSFSFALSQSLEILQMPQQELALWLQKEIEKNPLLEASDPPCALEGREVAYIPSLYEHLQKQVSESDLSPKEKQIASMIIGSLDEKGFLTMSLEESAALMSSSVAQMQAVLSVVQSFDPPGIAARSLQESLLLQLQRKQMGSSPVYHLVANHFSDLLRGRYTTVKKMLHIDPQHLAEAIQQLARLTLRPAAAFEKSAVSHATADLRASFVDQTWQVEIAEEEFPSIHIRQDLPDILPKLAAEEKKTVKQWLTSAKWLLRSLNRRKMLLLSLTRFCLQKQTAYLEKKGSFVNLSLQDLAAEFHVHESTIHRALAGKWIQGPWGLMPLRSLLSHSAKTVHHKYILQKLIEQENRGNPLTDKELSLLLRKKGISLARRTISKYRKELELGSAADRKFL